LGAENLFREYLGRPAWRILRVATTGHHTSIILGAGMNISKNLKRAGFAAVAAALVATGALAGARYGQPSVTVVKNADGTGWAYGTLGGTRNSAFPGERLSCSIGRAVTLNSTGGEVKVTTVICVAVDKNGVSATCLSTKEEFADALNGLSNDGLIDFRFTGARCDSIAVYESSSLERKR
jgi:hypothetical protein